MKTALGPDVIVDNRYAYDGNGNRLEKTGQDGTTRYAYDSMKRFAKVEYPDVETFDGDTIKEDEGMLSTYIERLLDILFEGNIKGVITTFLKTVIVNGVDQIAGYYCFENVIEQYLGKQKQQECREQLEVIIAEIKSEISKIIDDRSLDLFMIIERQLEDRFQKLEIPVECRENLKNLFQCYILDYIKNVDRNYYNELTLQFQMLMRKQHDEQQDKLINELYTIVFQLQRFEESPVTVPYMFLQIDDASKMVSRAREIEQIDNYFHKGSHVAVLYGRPGIGKTTLAKMFARDKHPSNAYLVKYERSIEYTVGKLAKEQSSDSGRRVLDYWRTSGEAQTILLIIDNYNGDVLQSEQNHGFAEELKGKFYQQLIATGIQIIITTRINTGVNVIEVSSVDDPVELFKMHYKNNIENEEKLIGEIIETLHKNTLLIILAAHIFKRCNSEEEKKQVLYKIRNCNIKTDLKRLPAPANMDNGEAGTIYQQAEALLDMSGILGEATVKKVFANIILLPLDGMLKREFLELTGCDENILIELINGSWVLSESNRIYLHPVMKEIALNKQFISYSLCEEYCKNIKCKIDIEEKLESKLHYKDYAQEIFNVFSENVLMNVTLLKLFYNLSDIYDQLDERVVSREIVEIVEANIEAFAEYPFEKARILSGIAYSLNNCYESMEVLEKANKLLDNAVEVVNEQIWDYVITNGAILSNFGSNYLAKSKCDPDNKIKYIKEALARHKQALQFRYKNYNKFASESKREKILRGAIATSYTAIATDYFYLEEYKKSIKTHLRALEIRKELGNVKGGSINQQRIVGSVIKWYLQQSGIKKSYIYQVLNYYPQLPEINHEYQDINSLKRTMEYWIQLMSIVENDKQFEEWIVLVKEKCKHMAEWIGSDTKLSEMFENQIEELRHYGG